MTGKTSLEVNGNVIKLDRFVRAFVVHTVSGMLESLDDTEPIANLILSINDKEIYIMLNGKSVSTNEFVNIILKSTLFGMVFPLKGVNIKNMSELRTLKIEFTR